MTPSRRFIPPPNPSLTAEEKRLLNILVEAWNLWITLDEKHPDDNPEMKSAIHSAQSLVALRVARRADPDIWLQPEKLYNLEQIAKL